MKMNENKNRENTEIVKQWKGGLTKSQIVIKYDKKCKARTIMKVGVTMKTISTCEKMNQCCINLI